ncbi:MAG: hypothetical protein APF80_11575 [Alphaproteobacteria bacterium BRH_c36]|nr:MAG: hypothetical protein APF80_11575 [Alphaproteobacteria bacterium BRH_c36]
MAVLALAGCAGDGASGPGAQPLPLGSSCQSIRAELRRLDNSGVPSKVEAVSAGRRVSDRDRQLANRYSELLNQYLGARCHT